MLPTYLLKISAYLVLVYTYVPDICFAGVDWYPTQGDPTSPW